MKLWQDEVWAKVLRRDPCVYCGAPSNSVEHVDPKGPRAPVANGVGACRSCNHERGNVPLIFYLLWRATDRRDSFKVWNWRQHPARIRAAQAQGKFANRARLRATLAPQGDK